MTVSHALIAFLLASGLLTITPGLDTALVLRAVTVNGPRRAAAAVLGICLGLLTWGLCASVGLGALLTASRLLYNVLRVAGSCYLIYLGCRMFLRAGSAAHSLDAEIADAGQTPGDSRHWFLRGLLTNLLNPKVGVFYATFLPVFVPAGVPVVGFSMLLATIHAAEGMLWFALLILAVRPLGAWLRNERAARSIDRGTGVVFVGFGLGLLFDRSR
jgi:threonine/homoserine/homoserine lactone efflux protein